MEGNYKILETIEQHPRILIAIVIVLICIIIFMYFGDNMQFINRKSRKSCRKKKNPLDNEEEMEELIESIHDKQRKKDDD